MIPSILGMPTSVSSDGPAPRNAIRTGRVTSPVDPTDAKYESYVERCLKMWTVDVELDSGEILLGCRVLSSQGNGREGVRRLPRLPQVGADGTVIPGDHVVVAFLNGAIEGPVVLGTLTPMLDPNTPLDEIEASHIATKDINEVQSRQEFVDLTDKRGPLVMATMERNTGKDHEFEHRGQMWVDGQARASQLLERSSGARNLLTEQMVEVNETTTALVHASNTEARELRTIHSVDAPAGKSSLTIEDLEAKVLQLTQQVEALGTLVLRSDNAKRLMLQQETDALRTSIISDSDSKMVTLVVEDRQAGTRSGWTIGKDGEVALRRVDSSGRETGITILKDSTVTVQSATGSTVHLGQGEVIVTSGGSSVNISDTDGVSLMTKGGSMVSAFDDSVVVTAPQTTINAGSVHLSTGAVLIGSSAAGAQRVPSAERLQAQMLRIEAALRAIQVWARTHTHPVAGTVAGPSPVVLSPTAAPTNLFNLVTDTLKTLKGL